MNVFEFFKRQLLVARVFGIPVRIDYRWFFVLALMAWLTATNIPTGLIEGFFVKLIFGLITPLIFFVSIFLHELAHAFAARLENVEVTEIVLHPFGGLARLRREPDNPRTEFRIAIAGPAASFLLSLVFLGLMLLSSNIGTAVLTPLLFLLFFWNMLLAVFNLFPGYPLDGGRILRAFLWKRGRELNEATILTGRAGQIIALALIIFGLFITLVRGDFFTGLWTVLVGLFLYDAAAGIIRQTGEIETITVGEIMSLPVPVAPDADVLHFVDRVLPLYRQTVFPVAKDKQFYGILMLEDLKKLPREDWHKTKIQDVMRPIEAGYFVDKDVLFSDARILMKENGIGALGVVDEQGGLVGFLRRGSIRKAD
ncbi:MAG: M50 family metallopeptidase [Pyrinomonadaceae bacterium]